MNLYNKHRTVILELNVYGNTMIECIYDAKIDYETYQSTYQTISHDIYLSLNKLAYIYQYDSV